MSHFVKGFLMAATLPAFVIIVELFKGAFSSGIGKMTFDD